MIGSVRHILTNTIDLGVMALFRAVLSQKDVSWWAGGGSETSMGSQVKACYALSATK